MKREIKFRFWSGESMMPHRELVDDKYTIAQLSSPLYIPMQFTGLVDKNGKEVYEGDIIKWKETRFHTEEQKENGVPMPKVYKSAVEWQDGEFIVSSDDNHDTPLCCFFGDSLDNKFDFKAEIIGNIYENPELI